MLLSFKLSGCLLIMNAVTKYTIVHYGEDYIAVWVKKRQGEVFDCVKSTVLEITGFHAISILEDVLPVDIKY